MNTLTRWGVVLAMALGATALALPASGAPGDVCDGLSSGKVDMPEGADMATVTVTAPAGYLIDGYCVKAGSANQEDGGPVYIEVDPPAAEVTFGHPTGKDISHWSVSFVPDPGTTTTTTGETTTTSTEAATTITGPEATTSTEAATTTTAGAPATTWVPRVTAPTPPELPYTGIAVLWLAPLGLALVASGGLVLRKAPR
jgi:LPXTG-motif cell wall-anchored protein